MSLVLFYKTPNVAATAIAASDSAAISVSDSGSVVDISPQFGRPIGEGVVGGTWTNSGGIFPLWEYIDEVVPNDADYLESPSNPTATEFYTVRLSPLEVPESNTGHVLRFRFAKSASAGRNIGMVVQVRQGDNTVVAELDAGTLDTTTFSQFEYTLSGAEAAALTNYEDVRLRFNPTSSGGGAGRAARISWAELEVPKGIVKTPIVATDTAAITVSDSLATSIEASTPPVKIQQAQMQEATFATSVTTTLPSPPTAGNLLVAIVSGDKNAGDAQIPNFTREINLPATSVSQYVFWKISNGTEQSATVTHPNDNNTGSQMLYTEWQQDGNGAWAVAGSQTNISADLNETSKSTGTTPATTHAGIGIATLSKDTMSQGDTVSWSNGYQSIWSVDPSESSNRVGLWVATKEIASGTLTETTATINPVTPDQLTASVVVFGRVPSVPTDPIAGTETTALGVTESASVAQIARPIATRSASLVTGNHLDVDEASTNDSDFINFDASSSATIQLEFSRLLYPAAGTPYLNIRAKKTGGVKNLIFFIEGTSAQGFYYSEVFTDSLTTGFQTFAVPISDITDEVLSFDDLNLTISPSVVGGGAVDSETSISQIWIDTPAPATTRPVSDNQNTTSIQITDTSELLGIITSNDSASLTVSETNTSLGSLASSDTGSIAISEITTSSIDSLASDTSSITVTEVAGIGSTIPGADTAAIGIAEEASISVITTASDAGSITVSETVDLVIGKTASDTAAITITDDDRYRSGSPTTNLLANPSWETDTSAWDYTEHVFTAATATYTVDRVLGSAAERAAADGDYKLRVTVTGSGTFAMRSEKVPINSSGYVQTGIDVRWVTGTAPVFTMQTQRIMPGAGGTSRTDTTFTPTNLWSRRTYGWTTTSSLYIWGQLGLTATVTAGDVFEIDAAQIELAPSTAIVAYNPIVPGAYVEKTASETRSLSVAEKRQITDPNKGTNLYDQLRPDINTSFEDGAVPTITSLSSNVATYSTSIVDDPTAPDGNKALRVEITGAGRLAIMAPLLPVEAATVARASIYAKQTAGTFRAISGFRATSLTSAGAPGSGNYGSQVTATGSWTRLSSGGGNMSSTAHYANVGFEADATQVGDVFYLDAAQLEYAALTNYNPINSKDRTDTVALSVSESVALEVISSDTDSGAITITESASSYVTSTAADTSSLTISEVAGIGSELPGSDTSSIGVSEETNISVIAAASDTSSITVSETVDIVIGKVAADTASIAVDEMRSRAIVGQENRLTNPSFNNATLPTYMSGPATVNMEIVDVDGAHGRKALQMTALTSGTYMIEFERIPVSPILYTHLGFAVYGKRVTGTPTAASLFIKQYNAAGAEISSSSKNVTFSDNWTRTNDTGTALGSTMRQASVQFNATFTAGDVILLDAVQLNEQSSIFSPAYDPLEDFQSIVASETRSLSVSEKRRITDPDKGTNLYDQLRPDINTSFEDGSFASLTNRSINVATYDMSVVDDPTAPDGNKALRIEITGAGKLSIMLPNLPVEASTNTLTSLYAKQTSGAFKSISVYRAFSTALNDNPSGSYGVAAAATGVWSRRTGGVNTMSSTTHYARIGFEATTTEVGDVFYLDALQLEYTAYGAYNPINSKDRTDTAAISLDDVGSVNTNGGADLVAGSESTELSVTETTTIDVTLAGTDTGALSVTETTDSVRTFTASDTSSLSVTEVAGIASTIPGNESITLGVVETSNIAITSSTTDTLSVSMTDESDILVSQSREDTGATSIDEATTTAVFIETDDASVLTMGDAKAFTAIVSSTDTFALSVSETTNGDNTAEASDSDALAVSETTVSDISINVNDTTALTANDQSNIASTLPGSENNSLAVIESASIFVTESTTDDAAWALAESASLNVILSDSDTTSLALEEASEAHKNIVGDDYASISLDDTAALYNALVASDSTVLAVSEVASSERTFEVTDEASITVTENANISSTLPGHESISLGVGEETSLDVTVETSDSSQIGTVEYGTLAVSVETTDAGTLTVQDENESYREIAVEDESTLSITDVNNFDGGNSDSDTASLSIDETTTLFKAIESTDEAALSVSENRLVSSTLPGQDTTNVVVIEEAHIFVSEDTSDSLALSVDDTGSLFSDTTQVSDDDASLAITETTSLDKSLDVTDSNTLTVSESRQLEISNAAIDTEALAVTEFIHINKSLTSNDELAIALTEAEALSQANALGGTETNALAVTESSTLSKTLQVNDTTGLRVTETTSSYRTKTASDTTQLVVTEITGRGNTLPGNDTASLGVVESATIYITSSATDAGTLSVAETAQTTVAYQNVSASDAATIALSETSSIAKTIVRTDGGGIRVVETVHLFKHRIASDTITIGLTEESNNGQGVEFVVYHNGEWVPGTPMVYKGGQWREIDIRIFKEGEWR